jgi:hypothetical protein
MEEDAGQKPRRYISERRKAARRGGCYKKREHPKRETLDFEEEI